MMANIAEKWERKMVGRGIPKYVEYAKSPKTEEWARRVGEAFDVTVGSKTRSMYEEGVKSVSPDEYARAVQGKGQKLVENAKRGLAI